MPGDAERGVVEVVSSGGVVTVSLVGPQDADSVDRVREAFSGPLDQAGALVIDVSRAHLIDSMALGFIFTVYERGRERGKPVVVVADARTPPVVRNLLRLSGIGRIIDIYPSVPDAVRRLRGDGLTSEPAG